VLQADDRQESIHQSGLSMAIYFLVKRTYTTKSSNSVLIVSLFSDCCKETLSSGIRMARSELRSAWWLSDWGEVVRVVAAK